MLAIAIYGLLIPASIAFQGGLAWYYFSRNKHVVKYRNETPEWVIEMQREGA